MLCTLPPPTSCGTPGRSPFRFLSGLLTSTVLAGLLSAPVGLAQESSSGGDAEAEEPEQELVNPAPPRAEGEGPFERLILRGATLVDGTGSPPIGPVDIVIEGNRIAEVKIVGAPRLAIDEEKRPKDATKEIDLTGHWVMPGIIDLHVHTGYSQDAMLVAPCFGDQHLYRLVL